MKIIVKKSLHLLSSEPLHPLLQKVITRIVKSGAGIVYITPDHHVFVKLNIAISELRGALDPQREGKAAGLRVVIRQAPKRGKYSLYPDLPDYQLYTLPIVQKNAATMSDTERLNIERNTLVLKRVHAIKRDPVQLAHYRRLHRLHLLNPTAGGYSHPYPGFHGFLVATLHLALAAGSVRAISMSASLPSPMPVSHPAPIPASLPISSIAPACHAGIAPARRASILHSGDIFTAASSCTSRSGSSQLRCSGGWYSCLSAESAMSIARPRSRPLICLPIAA